MHKIDTATICVTMIAILVLTGMLISIETEKVDTYTIEGNITKIERGYVYIDTKDGIVSLPLANVKVPVDDGYYIKIETRRK